MFMPKRHIVYSVVAAGTLLAATSGLASAADFGGPRGSIKDAPVPVYAYRWTGLYAGVHAGLATGQAEGGVPGEPFTNTEVDLDGALYGGQIGYNYQMGSAVIGIEGTYSAASIDGNSTCVVLLSCRSEANWVATAVGRLGYAMDRTMVYVLAGGAWTELDTEVLFGGVKLASGGATHAGWVAGFGVEHALSDRVSARIEYNHMDFGEERHNLDGVPANVDAEIDTIKLGINIKLTN